MEVRQSLRYKTPLRYPGGKAKLANFIKSFLIENSIRDGIYVEPYAGGAGVAIELLIDEYCDRIYINDLDRSIYAFWHCVLFETDELCSLIEDASLTVSEWDRQRSIQMGKKDADLLSLGFSTFFLNRTNVSGIIDGGIIGGREQKGKWGIEARFNRRNLCDRIKKIASYRSRIILSNQDALRFLDSVKDDIGPNSLTYLDPPYFGQGRNLYSNFYSKEDHALISRYVESYPYPWIVSYDNVDGIRQLYKKFRSITYDINYSAGDSYKGREVIFFSHNSEIPKVLNPTKVDRAAVQMRLSANPMF